VGTITAGTGGDYSTIQAAVDAAGADDVVQVLAGTFNENVTLSKSSVTLQGTLDSNGDWLSILEPPLTSITWTLDEGIGPNVYKTTDISWGNSSSTMPAVLSYDGIMIARIQNYGDNIPPQIGDGWMGSVTGEDDWGWVVLGSSQPYLGTVFGGATTEAAGGVAFDFWSAIYSIWAQHPSDTQTTYFRHADGTNPNTLNIVVSDYLEKGVSIYAGSAGGTEYRDNTIKDLWIRGFYDCINFRNTGCINNVIDHCKITAFAGGGGIRFYEGPTNCVIRNSYISSNPDAKTTGAWGNAGNPTTDKGRNQLIYEHWKYNYHTTDSDSVGFISFNESIDCILEDNIFERGLVAISNSGSATSGLIIRNNIVRDWSSVGMTLLPGASGEIYGNLLHNNNKNFRIHRLQNDYDTTWYVYNNLSCQLEKTGDHIFTHWLAGEPVPVNTRRFYFYHNSFHGGDHVIYYQTGLSDAYGDMPELRFLNNICNAYSPITPEINPPSTLGAWDYNWMGGVNRTDNFDESWWGANNIVDEGAYLWPVVNSTDLLPSWIVPITHAAKYAAGPLPETWPLPVNPPPRDMGAWRPNTLTPADAKIRAAALMIVS
jgi:hypothetical protein